MYRDLSVKHCYQCRKCSGGCPVSNEMDLKPNEVIRLVQLGNFDKVISNQSLWFCMNCRTCSSRCPNNVDVAKVFSDLKNLALENNKADKKSANFYKAFNQSIKKYGRIHEMSILLNRNNNTFSYLHDLGLGLNMLAKGKLKLKPITPLRKENINRLIELTKEEEKWK